MSCCAFASAALKNVYTHILNCSGEVAVKELLWRSLIITTLEKTHNNYSGQAIQ